MKRRHFLAGLSTLAMSATTSMGWAQQPGRIVLNNLASRPRLKMPPLLDTTATGHLNLVATAGESEFFDGTASPTLGYNQPYLGPVIRMQRGAIRCDIGNRTRDDVTVHWHGLVVPGDDDGGPHQPIPPGGAWRPELDIAQNPATAWYHSHIHGRTANQVYAGLAGGIIVGDGRDDQRGLPSTYGEDDLFIVLQDRNFSADGRMIYNLGMMDRMTGFTGNTMLVNGQIGAVAAVPKGIVRLRLLNGSNARFYRLKFDDRRPMHLIACDGGYLPSPRALDELRLAPGERAEILVDFSDDRPALMTSLDDPNAGMGAMMGRAPSLRGDAPGSEFAVLAFAPDSRKTARVEKLPDAIDGALPGLDSRPVAAWRDLMLDVGMGGGMGGGGMGRGGMMGGAMSINGRSFDMRRIDLTVALGSIERWRLRSPMLAHPFHIHGVLFQVLTENGRAPRPENAGWKDTMVIDNEAELLIKFDKPASREKPFMYHCHILEHEDAGMMGQFTVS